MVGESGGKEDKFAETLGESRETLGRLRTLLSKGETVAVSLS